MKKLFAYLAVLIFVVVLASSCNANKKCPAYSILRSKLRKSIRKKSICFFEI